MTVVDASAVVELLLEEAALLLEDALLAEDSLLPAGGAGGISGRDARTVFWSSVSRA